MKTRALAVLLPLLALAGCADNNVSVQVYAQCAMPDTECVFSSTCDAQYIGANYLDVGLADTHWAFLEIHNQLLDNSDESAGRPNTHDAYVEEYTVDYSGALALPSVTVRIPTGPSVVPTEGSSVISVFPIPPAIGQLLGTSLPAGGTQLVARVRLRGFYADQNEFETAEYPITINVCDGCVEPPACADATQVLLGTCPPTVNDQGGQLPLVAICD